jgi:hypothetical protein
MSSTSYSADFIPGNWDWNATRAKEKVHECFGQNLIVLVIEEKSEG